MDSSNDDGPADPRELLNDDEPTNQHPALDPEAEAVGQAAASTADNVVDPNVIALRRVDAEIRRLMESWVDLESQLDDRDAEIRRLSEQGRRAEEDVQTTRHELAAARADCERLRGEAVDQRARAEEERRLQEEKRQQAEKLQLELLETRGRLVELEAERAQEKVSRGQLEAQLAEQRDALIGMADHLGKLERASHGNDEEKADLAERIVDMERRGAELTSQLRAAEALGATRHGELQRELNAERDKCSGLRKKLKSSEQAVNQAKAALERQRQKTEAALNTASRTEQLLAEHRARLGALDEVEAKAAGLGESLATAEAAAIAAAAEREKLMATIDARDTVIAGLRERASKLDAERKQLVAQLDEQRAQVAAVDSEFQAKRKSIAALGSEFDRLGAIQANVRKLDGMMSRQLSSGSITDADLQAQAERPRNCRLIVWLDGDKAMKYPLFKPEMVIGRSRSTDIRVSGPHTSRRHARVIVDDGVVMIEDLGSLNGITVNEKAVTRHELHDGDVLDVGGARLRFVDLDDQHAASGA